MLSWQWRDGKFLRCDSIPLADRGFRYGMSVFESFRVVNGNPLFLAEHLDLLLKSCLRLDFHPEPIPLDSVRKTLGTPGEASLFNGLARLYVTAGEGGAADGVTHSRVILFMEERAPVSEQKRENGYTLAIDPEKHRPLFGGLKTANYWGNLSALSRARLRGKDEAVLCDGEDRVLSASLANLFIVRDGRIQTPPAASGARAGVLRAWVAGRRLVHECALSADDLAGAGEIFLTSSWLGVMPARALEDRVLPSRSTALALQAEYEAEVAGPGLA